ncbi:MAG: type II secretion system major pseudopilin GspG [Gammaproteobacteria bacterium]|nr:type II secretion system major pseudopilin GspG [Gammaproteobacteria bacterium]
MKHQKSRGFTLIEVMVVVVILAILAAIIVPRILKRPEQARIVAAKQDVLSIQNALSLYKLDNGFYPSTDQGIDALVHQPSGLPKPVNWSAGGYLKKLPVDPWQNPYHYAHPGRHGSVDIWSDGPSDVNPPKEIGNWDGNQ